MNGWKKIPVLFLMMLSVYLQAQTVIEPERLSIKDGLSQGFISDLLQDREGFLWIGTKNGLNRYNGEQFEVFTNDSSDPFSISHDWVSKLYEVGDFLLIGTVGGGLNIFHKRSKNFYKIPQTNPKLKSWSTMDVQDILVDTLGQIWILEQSSGLVFWLRLPENFWQRLPEEEHLLQDIEIKRFSDIFLNTISYDGKFIYGLKYPNQLLKINTNSGDLEWPKNQPPDVGLIAFASDVEHGLLAFSTEQNKILYLKNGKWLTITTDFNIVKMVYLEDKHQLWVSSGFELLMFDQWVPDGQAINRADASAVISNSRDTYKEILEDQSGIIWVETGGYGILKITLRLLKIKNYFNGTSIGAAPFMTRDGDVIVSTTEGTLLETSLSPFLQQFPNGTWWLEDKDGIIWLIGKQNTEVGAYQLNKLGQLQKKAVLDSVSYDFHTAVIEPETSIIWVASPTGKLIRYEPSTNEWKTYGFQHLFHSSYDCYALTQTANGHWWIGTSRGLVHGIPNGKGLVSSEAESFDFELIQTKEGEVEGILNNDVASLLTDPSDANILWLGTKGGGLHRLDSRTMTFTYLNSKNGLPNDVIYGVLTDDNGNLWMSSNKGIIRYQPTTGLIRNFTEADGMQSNEFNTWAYAKSHTGELLFGGINGLNVFHPQDLEENLVLPNVWITALAINNQPVVVGDSTGLLQNAIEYTPEITLPISQNSIALEFAALEFSAPKKNRFRYYLEGAETEWIHEDTDNKATYLSLASGSYTFKVKASNGDGVWNEQPTELKITILPPWYRSTLAYFIYAFLIGFGIWQFLQFQKRRFELKHVIEQKEKEKERLKELDQAKSRLYTNITHEFRTPLTVISGLINQLDNHQEIKEPIQRNSYQLLNLVNQMLDLRKLESGDMSIHYMQGDIIRYIRYLTESFQSYANSIGVAFHFLAEKESLIMDFDKEKITRIVSNLLSNAIKFTPEGGNIYIRTEVKDLLFSLEIKDTGKGISKSELPHIFNRFYQVDDTSTRKGEGTGIGLTLVKELLTAMKGSIEVSSIEGKGATFSMTLPIANDAPEDKKKGSPQNIFIPKIITEKEKRELVNATTPTTTEKEEKPTILLIEDNADVIHYLIKCLQADYNLDIAMNGEEGIDKAIENTPDFIVSDVMMPKKDGFEVCQTLKNDERTSHIPIILLTAKANIESRLEGLQRGADAYLNKPFHQEELLLHIQNLLALRKKLHARYSNLTNVPSTSIETISIENEAPQPLELEDAFLQKIRAIIEKDLSNSEIGMAQLVQKIGMSRSQIYKKVKALTGKSPSQYIRSIRLVHAKQLLKTTDLNISEVGYEVGFTSPVYFSQVFFEEFGLRPNETRK